MISARLTRLFFAGTLVALSAQSVTAQTSSVTIEPGADGSRPTPANALEIADVDFPLESILANERGKVTIRFTTDGNGRPGSILLVSSSGVSRLDQQAAQIARTRWQFGPNTNVDLSINWNPPAEPVPEFRLTLPRAPEGTSPPKATNSHAVMAEDYPGPSIGAGERGLTVLHYAVQENGTVGDVRIATTSGYPRLDEAATRMIRRWTFEPARLDGRPVVFWLSASVDFNIFGSISPARASRPACFERPHIGDDDVQEKVLITATLMGSSGVPATRPNVPINTRTIRRWVRITEAGAVVDVLLGTSTGFMRLSKPLIDQMAQASRYQRPGNPSGCWHLEQIPLNR